MSQFNNSKQYQVFVKDNSRTNLYRIPVDSTIEELTEVISNRLNIPSKFFFLIYAGKVLRFGNTISFYNITEGSTIDFSIRHPTSPPPAPTLKRSLTDFKWKHGLEAAEKNNSPALVQINYGNFVIDNCYYIALPNGDKLQGSKNDLISKINNYGFTWDQIIGFDY